MNRKIGMAGSLINALTVLLFAIFMLTDFITGSFFVCIILSISFVCMVAALEAECTDEGRAAGKAALAFSVHDRT